MENLKRTSIFILLMVAWLVPDLAFSDYAVCRRQTSRGCYICSDFFHVNSEDEAVRRCRKLRSGTYLFPNFASVAAWKIPNCTCEDEDPAPGK